MRLLRSTAFRLALGYGAVFVVSMSLLVGYLFWRTTVYLTHETDRHIRAEAESLRDRWRRGGPKMLATAIEERLETEDYGALYLLVDPAGVLLAGNLDAGSAQRLAVEGVAEVMVADEVEPSQRRNARLRSIDLGGYRLLVGRDVGEQHRMTQQVGEALTSASVAALLIAVIGAEIFRRVVVRRVQSVNRASQDIMAGDLLRRVPTTGSGDEFDMLAVNLNRMLDRIQHLLEGVRHVSDTIAHDLRSPLTRLKTSMEAAITGTPDAATCRAAVERAMTDIDAIVRLFNSLLRIARVEAGSGREAFVETDLCAVVDDMADFYRPLAEEKGMFLAVIANGPAAVMAEPHLLSQAIANLLDNAIKFSPTGTGITVTVRASAEIIEIEVADHGPGIPLEARPRVTERFYRLDRSRSTPGSGLGLTLVAAVATLHGGALVLLDNHPGLKAVLHLPRLPAGVYV